ncbi:MAG: hypothetical protein HWD85_08485 [Flavobacteriaceae bacterium]|nr:hypothetical protein [Flavobacteriaceae bacterium]
MNKKSVLQEVDTIINFTSVDASPTFNACKDIIDKEAKSNCFRTQLYKQVSVQLAKHRLVAKNPVDEMIQLEVIINSKGEIAIKKIESSSLIRENIIGLDSILNLSVKALPKIFPAIKRGIPVTTLYKLPIQIQVK